MEIALYEPEIPPNTGNIARLCVCTSVRLHIIGQPAFRMNEKAVKRAGLDYWDRLDLRRHRNWEEFLASADEEAKERGIGRNILLVSKFGKRIYSDHEFKEDDILVLGRETNGLPESVHESVRARNPDHILRIPMAEGERSLNLANAAAIVLYEALRQGGYKGLSDQEIG